MTNEITEIEKAASILFAVANDYNARAKDRTVCLSASGILKRIATKLRQDAPLYVPATKFTGVKIIKLIKDQEVA